MSKNNTTTTGGGGMGCLGIFVLIALVATAWMWSQGMDPRAATEAGMILSAKITGGLCLLVALFVAGLFGLGFFKGYRRR